MALKISSPLEKSGASCFTEDFAGIPGLVNNSGTISLSEGKLVQGRV